MHPTKTILISILLLLTNGVSAQEKSIFAYVYNQPEVSISLSSKVKDIKRGFEKNESKVDGMIEIKTPEGAISLETSFVLGGKSRRKICKNPPVKLNFKKPQLEELKFFKECDKTKIVFQCQSGGTMKQSLLMEKTLYDIYGLLSDYGRRAKTVSVQDPDQKELLGFLLEDDDDFEIRTKTEILKNRTISPTILIREEYVKMCLFQYMISNADWSAKKGHNTDLYKRLSDNALIIVPYDFDYSGIINNNYALAPENLPINAVTDRYFMDKSVSLEELKNGIAFFQSKEGEIKDLINNSVELSGGTKKKMVKFIDGFYKTVSNSKKVKRMIN
jgi:hypothetical protein